LSLEDDLLKQRLTRIREIEALGYRGYGRRFEFTHTVPAILAEFAEAFGQMPTLKIDRIGYGVGSRDLATPRAAACASRRVPARSRATRRDRAPTAARDR